MTSLSAQLSATQEINKLKSIQWSWWQSRYISLSAFLICTQNFFWHTSGDPLVIKNDKEKTDETDSSISMESEISTIHIKSSHLREQSKGCLSLTITKSITSLDHFISLSIALFCNWVEQTICKGDHRAAVIIYLSHTITVTLSLSEQPKDQEALVLNEQKWEIIRIIDKRQTERDYE